VSLIGRVRGAAARAFRGPGARAAVGMLEWLAASPPGTFAALTYHRVDERNARTWLYPFLLSATPCDFEAQMTAVLRHHRPIALADLLAASRGSGQLPPRAVLVTFDDAYRDFRDNAWPILKKLGIPVTLFVPTAFPDAPERAFWWDRVWQALTAAQSDADLDTPVGPLSLRTDQERRVAARALVEHYKSVPHGAAMQGVAALCDRVQLGPAVSEVLGWDDLRSLGVEGVGLAAHSRSHPLLTRLPVAEARVEVEGSSRDLEGQLGDGAFPNVFAYPAGAHDKETRRVLSELRIELAFTTERGVNRIGRSDPLVLRRINVGIRSQSEVIRAQIAVARLQHRVRRD
jgi:peptidoglycan/xylan/chitin deacetylase (PgdA/CDA1 family)